MRAWTAYAALLALPLALATDAASAQAQGSSVDPIAAFRCEQAHETANYGDAFSACAPLAEQGLTDAQLILADLYLRGLGVPQNLSEAARWHRAAAEQGVPQAQFNLGIQYRYGSGVPQDLVEAHIWLNEAAAAGHADAATALSLTERRMTQGQLAAARSRKPQLQTSTAAPAATQPGPAAATTEPTASQRDTIAATQSRLAQLGYAPGPADGLMGSRTRTAIRQFQASRGLPIDGQATRALLTELDASIAVRRAAATASQPATSTAAGTAAETTSGRFASNPNPDVQAVIEELKGHLAQPAVQVDRGLRTRLEELVRRYDWPWSRTVLSEDFGDGDYVANPTWTAAAGQFDVSPARGLVTRKTASTTRSSTRSSGGGDIASQLLGAIVSEVLQSQLGTAPVAAPEIFTQVSVPESFVITIDMTAQALEKGPNRLTIGLFQDQLRTTAYQLRYTPGPGTRIALVRASGGREATLGSQALPQRLDDGQTHQVQWRRDGTGKMAIIIDGGRFFVSRIAASSVALPASR